LIAIGAAIALVGGVAAYNYNTIMTLFEERKEHLFMQMNQGTIVVSGVCVCVCVSVVRSWHSKARPGGLLIIRV